MRTLVVGDLHLGCGAHTNIFSGARAFAALLEAVAVAPTRVVLNGDTFDFLAQEVSRGVAAEQVMHMFAEDATTAGVLAALGRVLARGGALLFRAGEHDPDLGDRGVQAMLVRAITGGGVEATRIGFAAGGRPTLLEVGGARVVVTHDVLDRDGATNRWLATRLLNPLRREYGVGLADLLRPDYADAVVAALAVNPTTVKQVLRSADGAVWAAITGAGVGLLPRVCERSGLTPREREVLTHAVDPELSAVLSPEECEVLERARIKLFHRVLGLRGAPPGDRLRRPDGAEWSAARRLAERFEASAVVFGHSRAVGWRADHALTAVDTGTWTWLLDRPLADAWQQRLAAWQRIHRIAGGPAEGSLRSRWTAALIEPRVGRDRARLMLLEWRTDRGPVLLRERWLPVPAG